MSSMSRKKVVPILFLTYLFVACCWYKFQKYISINQNSDVMLTYILSCHYETEMDGLRPIEELGPPPLHSLFFHETSCRGCLNSRQACAIESAARSNPGRSIYVLFNSPISKSALSRSSLANLTRFRNVKLARLHSAKYARGTPLAEIFTHGEYSRSPWPIEHIAVMLR